MIKLFMIGFFKGVKAALRGVCISIVACVGLIVTFTFEPYSTIQCIMLIISGAALFIGSSLIVDDFKREFGLE